MNRARVCRVRRDLAVAATVALIAAALPTAASAADASRPTVDDFRASPNLNVANSRLIRFVVIHTIQGSYWGGLSWFQNPASRVSAHYTVSKEGRLGQSVAEKNVAWHAGNRTYNWASIGIEHEGSVWDRDNYTDAMLRKSAALTRYLCDKYDIPMDRAHILGHNEVPGSTHIDPGPYFPWQYYVSLVVAAGDPVAPPAPPQPPARPPVKAIEVVGSYVNVRATPNGALVGHVHDGSRFVKIGEESGWIKVWFAGRTAWIYKGLTAPLTSGAAEEVKVARAAIREGAATASRIVDHAAIGQKYVRFATASSWRQIQFGHNKRWISAGEVVTGPIR